MSLDFNTLASSSRSVKGVVGRDDLEGLLNSKVLWLVMTSIFFFSRFPTEKWVGNFYQRNRKPFFHSDNQEDLSEKTGMDKLSVDFSQLACSYSKSCGLEDDRLDDIGQMTSSL